MAGLTKLNHCRVCSMSCTERKIRNSVQGLCLLPLVVYTPVVLHWQMRLSSGHLSSKPQLGTLQQLVSTAPANCSSVPALPHFPSRRRWHDQDNIARPSVTDAVLRSSMAVHQAAQQSLEAAEAVWRSRGPARGAPSRTSTDKNSTLVQAVHVAGHLGDSLRCG